MSKNTVAHKRLPRGCCADRIRAWEDYRSETLAVYIAPMKCLVQQKVAEWRKKFSLLGLKVAELTGDSDEARGSVNGDISTNLICTTPEKWDVEFRRRAGPMWLNGQKVSVYLIDEVHVIGEPDRGPVLEAVLTRTIARCTNESTFPRFIAVSATIANPNDIGRWLGRNVVWHGFSFGAGTRVIPVDASVRGYYCPPDRSPFHFDAQLNYKLPMLLREVLPSNRSALIFVSNRGATVTCAKLLAQTQWARLGSTGELLEVARSFKDTKLAAVVKQGVGYHNAGLSFEDRSLIEKTFNRGLVRILVCTTTLAMGVNLPAYLVVIRGTTMMTGGTSEQYSAARIHQMIGRAGRPGLEECGKAIIMTTSNHIVRYETILRGEQDTVESYLQYDLIRHVNNEIVHRSIRNLADVIAWLKSTFFFVRIGQNPKRYLPTSHCVVGLDKYLAEQCQRALDSLFAMGLIDKADGRVKSTELGRIFSRFYMSFNGFESFVEELRNIPSDGLSKERLLITIVYCPDFDGVQIRSGEKVLLRRLNTTVRYPLQTRPSQWKEKEKIFLLLQSNLDGTDVADAGPRIERLSMLKVARRVSRCLLESVLCLHNQKTLSERLTISEAIRHYRTIRNVVLVAKSFECGFWHNSVLCLQQLADVGVTRGSRLMMHGLTSFRALRDAEPIIIEMVTRTLPPFGTRLKARAEIDFPRYSVRVVGNPNHLDVTLSLANHDVNAARSAAILLVGNEKTGVLFLRKVSRHELIGEKGLSLHIQVTQDWDTLNVHLMNETLAGVDVDVSVNNPNASSEKQSRAKPSSDPANLLAASSCHSSQSSISPSPPNSCRADLEMDMVDPELLAADGWKVSEINRWAVEMLLAQPSREKSAVRDSPHIAWEELTATVEDAICLLDLDTKESADGMCTVYDACYRNEALACNVSNLFTKNISLSPAETCVASIDDGCIRDSPFEYCKSQKEKRTGKNNTVDHIRVFTGSSPQKSFTGYFNSVVDGNKTQDEHNISYSPVSPTSSEDSFGLLLHHADQDALEGNVQSRRSPTPDDLFDNIPSPKSSHTSIGQKITRVSSRRQQYVDNVNTFFPKAKPRTKRARSNPLSVRTSDSVRSLDGLSNHSVNSTQGTSVKRSGAYTKNDIEPSLNQNSSQRAAILPADLSDLAPTFETGLTLMTEAVPGNCSSKPPYRRPPPKPSQLRVARARAANISYQTNALSAKQILPSVPAVDETSDEVSEISKATTIENIMNLIQEVENFCKN